MSIAATMSARMKDAWINGVRDNPVVAKELRTRMRGRKGFMVMGGYVLFLGIVLLISYYAMWIATATGYSGQSLVNARLGLKLFMSLNWTQTVLLALIIPSLTSGALTLELEKKTIEMLVLTRLTPGTVVLGKHLTGIFYSLILLLCSLPLAGICLMFGGISPAEVFVTYLLLIAWTFILSATGVFWSSLFNRTAAAVLLTYGTCLGYLLATLGSGSIMVRAVWGGYADVNAMALLNPGWAPWGALLKATVCGLKVPIYLPPLIQHFIYGSALLFIATMHVKYLRAEKALPARILLICASLLGTWLTVGDASYARSVGSMGIPALVSTNAGGLFVLFGILAPIFATGRMPLERRSGLVSLLDPRKMFKSDLGGAFCFILLWVILEYLAFIFTLKWSVSSAHAKMTAAQWVSLYKIGVMCVSVVAAMASISIFASAVLKLRRNAVAVAIVSIIMMFAGYALILANYNFGASEPGGPVWQLAAFWPVTPLIVEAKGWTQSMPVLWWPKELSWMLVSGFYGALSLVLLFAAPKLAKKFGGVQEEQY
jgi:ABC-type transport system involved in multi-copper enzyme maturation permease subunit